MNKKVRYHYLAETYGHIWSQMVHKWSAFVIRDYSKSARLGLCFKHQI